MKRMIMMLAWSMMVFASALEVNVLASETVNHFPDIASSLRPKVAEKINTVLQVSELDIVPGSYKNPYTRKDPSSPYFANNGDAHGFSYKMTYVSERLTSISISGEGCGAYCESFTHSYLFDLNSGDRVTIEEMLTPEGITALQNSMIAKNKETMQTFLQTLQNSTGEDIQTQKDMYNSCISDTRGTIANSRYFIGGNGTLSFVHPRCSNHAIAALDDLGEFTNTFAHADVQPYLTPYGQSLMGGAYLIPTVNTPQYKMFKGTVDNRYPVTLVMDKIESDGSVMAHYWYDKQRKLIPISGRYSEGKLTLKEERTQGGVTTLAATIQLDWQGGKLIGFWQDATTSQRLAVDLNLY